MLIRPGRRTQESVAERPRTNSAIPLKGQSRQHNPKDVSSRPQLHSYTVYMSIYIYINIYIKDFLLQTKAPCLKCFQVDIYKGLSPSYQSSTATMCTGPSHGLQSSKVFSLPGGQAFNTVSKNIQYSKKLMMIKLHWSGLSRKGSPGLFVTM